MRMSIDAPNKTTQSNETKEALEIKSLAESVVSIHATDPSILV